MTEKEMNRIARNMSGDKLISLYASAINQTPVSSMPHRFENEDEIKYYLQTVEEIKQQTEEYKKQGINMVWEIPNM